jgi:hypothetical protein
MQDKQPTAGCRSHRLKIAWNLEREMEGTTKVITAMSSSARPKNVVIITDPDSFYNPTENLRDSFGSVRTRLQAVRQCFFRSP